MAGEVTEWLADAISIFGVACKEKLAGPGDREAAIRSPIEALLKEASAQLGVKVVPHDEVQDPDRESDPTTRSVLTVRLPATWR